jgi:hypothetical protein
MSWDDIRGYRLSLELSGVTGDLGYVMGPLAWMHDYVAGRRGVHQSRFGMVLHSQNTSIAFNWRSSAHARGDLR